MPNNIAGSETCLLVVRVIKLSQNIKQTGSFEKVRDNLLQRGENKYFWYQLAFSCQVCVGQSVHLLLSSVVLTSLHIVCWKEPAARGGWRWCLHGMGGVAPRCLWGLPCVPQGRWHPGAGAGRERRCREALARAHLPGICSGSTCTCPRLWHAPAAMPAAHLAGLALEKGADGCVQLQRSQVFAEMSTGRWMHL